MSTADRNRPTLNGGETPLGGHLHRNLPTLNGRAELFAGRDCDEHGLRALLDRFRELHVDRQVAETAGRIRRESGIPTPDALIAATAIEHQLPLVTRNQRHFERVPGLTIRAPG